MTDVLGDRCKLFEQMEAGRVAMPGLPLLARLDGRSFSAFTRGMNRPYDERMSTCMQETTRYIVQQTHALIGYTQSDEISLAWWHSAHGSESLFGGKLQKLTSVLAGMASAKFVQLVAEHIPEKAGAVPHFDCRVWSVPTVRDATEVFVWREDDATKNSITMAARALFSDRELYKQTSADKLNMLHERGINWQDYPAFFKRGVYFRRETFQRTLTDEERDRIPESHRPSADATFDRSQVVSIDMPPIRCLANATNVLFLGETPMTVQAEV